MIAVIDYGMGNLRSVEKALEKVGADARITSKPADIARCEKLVLPGVGAFGDAMEELKRLKLVAPIRDAIIQGKTFLGLCLGMQLLFDGSDEAPGVKGLSVLHGNVRRFKRAKGGLKVPHMGWNVIRKESGADAGDRGILRNIPDLSYVYFVHSYYVVPKDSKSALTTTDYGISFVSSVHKDNVYGFQFHPEKSQTLGLKILANFIKL